MTHDRQHVIVFRQIPSSSLPHRNAGLTYIENRILTPATAEANDSKCVEDTEAIMLRNYFTACMRTATYTAWPQFIRNINP